MDNITVLISFSTFALLIISAFLSASETSLTGASPGLIHRLDRDGNKPAHHVNQLLKHKEQTLGGILLGNNLVNITATALATVLLTQIYGSIGVFYATIIMTTVIVLFAEIAPKSYAIANPVRVALTVAPLLRPIIRFLSPATTICRVFVSLFLRGLGVTDSHKKALFSAHEEIRGAIDLHHSAGNVIKHDKDRLRGVLDLRRLKASDVMVHRKNIVAVNADDPVEQILADILASPYTRVPLWEKDSENIIGTVHAKNLLMALHQHRDGETPVNIRHIATKPWFVPDTTNLQDQLDAFLTHKNHFAIIVDEYGEVMGLLTLEDVLEEIVGDIADEHDVDPQGFQVQHDSSVLVDGSTTIRDLNRAQDWNLPEHEATTLAGIVIHEAQAIPESGQVFSFHGFRFEILKRRRNQILQLRVTKLAPED